MPNDTNHPEDDPDAIRDSAFVEDIQILRSVRSFLLKQMVAPAHLESFELLERLRYEPNGRYPSAKEWEALEDCALGLYPMLSGDLRGKFLATQAPPGIARSAICAAVLAVVACAVSLFAHNPYGYVAGYAIWSTCMGVLGSLAFVGMNVLLVQTDATFDISNRRLTVLRIAIGGLFGLVLAFPFGIGHFTNFLDSLAAPAAQRDNEIAQATYLVLPFVLGFSTTVVIAILGRLMQSVQALFGTLETLKTPPAVQVHPKASIQVSKA